MSKVCLLMRVLIYTFGTQGDILPYVALARGLVRAGHEAVVCTAEGFRGLVEARGAIGVGLDLARPPTGAASRPVKLSTSAWIAIGAPGSLVGTVAQPALSLSKWLADDSL